MAIKIDGQDLLKKFIGWQEIVRIYKNGGEIRPNTVPPVQPTYHVISDFTQWSLPSDYSIVSWSAVYTSNGISVDTSGWSSELSINTNTSSGFPSLKNATKIRIEIKFYWDVANSSAMVVILGSEWVTISKSDARFDSSTPWVYSFSHELDLQTYTTKLTMTTPLGVTTYTTWESYDYFVWKTRESTWLTFRLFPWVALSDVDVYIWESNIVYVNSISNIGTITTSPWATVTQTISYSPDSANSSANLWVAINDIWDWVVEDAETRLINGSIVLTISMSNRTGTESFFVVDQRNGTILRSFTVNSI